MKKLPKFQPSDIRLRPRGLTSPGAYTSFDLVGVRIGMRGQAWLDAVVPQPEELDYRHVVVITAVCTEGAYIGHRITNQLVVKNMALPYHKALRHCVSEWQAALQRASSTKGIGTGVPCFIAVANVYDLFEHQWWLCLVPGDERPATPVDDKSALVLPSGDFLGELS